MERFSDRLFGVLRIRINGAEPLSVVNKAISQGFELWGTEPINELTIEVSIHLRDSKKIFSIVEKLCCELEIIEKVGLPINLKKLEKRLALIVLPILLFVILVFSGLFIWQIDIEGNDEVSETEIRCVLEECGLHVGSFYPAFCENTMRNDVLLTLPKLRAVSICVRGCRATVEVRERIDIPELTDEKGAENVIAGYPGLLEDIRVFRGKGQLVKGQTVATGDVLISGAVDSTFAKTIITSAEGEAHARTWYEISAIAPLTAQKKCYTGKDKHRFALQIGKNRINFYKNSGILGMKCDNIIKEHKAEIKDVFSLPISLVSITTKPYQISEIKLDENVIKKRLEDKLMEELLRDIGDDGKTISVDFTFAKIDNTAVCTLRAECKQDIAEKREMTAEEITIALEDKEEETTE